MATKPKALTVMCTGGTPRVDCLYAAKNATEQAGGDFDCVRAFPITTGRNIAAHRALDGGYSHLWFVDDDVLVPPDALALLLALESDLASGCVPYFSAHHLLLLNVVADKSNGSRGWLWHWKDGPFETAECSTACLLIKREVLESLRDDLPWFRFVQHPKGDMTGEDIDFSRRVMARGHRAVCHGDVRCGHYKMTDISRLIPKDRNGEPYCEVPEHIKAYVSRRHAAIAINREYASHIPVLEGIVATMPVRRVIEFGAGRWSTRFFLDRDACPDVEHVLSLEENEEWFSVVRDKHQDDPRLELVLGSQSELLDRMRRAERSDVALVDGSIDIRRPAIDAMKEAGAVAIIVAHDSEDPTYNYDGVREQFRYSWEYDGETPRTLVLSDSVDLKEIGDRVVTSELAAKE